MRTPVSFSVTGTLEGSTPEMHMMKKQLFVLAALVLTAGISNAITLVDGQPQSIYKQDWLWNSVHKIKADAATPKVSINLPHDPRIRINLPHDPRQAS